MRLPGCLFPLASIFALTWLTVDAANPALSTAGETPIAPAQKPNLYKSMPVGHEKNKRLAISAYEANLHKHTNDSNVLVLPGLVADKQKRRVEVMAESTGLAQNAPCEFTLVGENSEHAYETLLISFAQPSAIHQALQFIGLPPGKPIDPEALRYWARGNYCELSVAKDGEPPVPLERLLLDRRTEATLPEEGFRFIGSSWLPDSRQRGKKLFAADALQPMAIVSLFNSTWSLLEVPCAAAQGDVYQNIIVNPKHRFAEGELLQLLIEPVKQENAKEVKDLVLKVAEANPSTTNRLRGMALLKNLTFELKDGPRLLNVQPSISSVMQALGACDRKKSEYYLTIKFGEDVGLGEAQALANILSIIDCERGVRIEPPPAGQLYYRAFTPDRDLLDRDNRMFHPWELYLSESGGVVSGKLLGCNSVYAKSGSQAELHMAELNVSSPRALRQELDAEDERATKFGHKARPPVIMVFAPSTFKYGQLVTFLDPALSTHKIVHVYLDEPMSQTSDSK